MVRLVAIFIAFFKDFVKSLKLSDQFKLYQFVDFQLKIKKGEWMSCQRLMLVRMSISH